jgi:hypothetical protein
LTSEQQGLRDEMQRMLDNYYVKDGRQMLWGYERRDKKTYKR